MIYEQNKLDFVQIYEQNLLFTVINKYIFINNTILHFKYKLQNVSIK